MGGCTSPEMKHLYPVGLVFKTIFLKIQITINIDAILATDLLTC